MKNFEELIKNNYGLIFGTAYKILHNQEDTEDCAQEVMLKAFINQDKFEGKCKFSTWLTRIAINQALMKLRYDASRPHFNFSDLDTPEHDFIINIPSRDAAPERRYESKELANKLLDGISPALKNSFLLNALEGMTSTEISKKLKVPASTIKCRWFRTRKLAQEKAVKLGITC